jgi:hypothetical protein
LLGRRIASRPPPSADEESAAAESLMACVAKAVTRLDDGVSDARTVAMSVEPVCSKENRHALEVYTRGMSPYEAALFDEKYPESFMEVVVTVILDQRAKRRG